MSKPIFAKRHYEALAAAFQEAKALPAMVHETGKPTRSQWDMTVELFADELARDNPKFNRARFIAACQPGANVRARNYPITLIGDEGHAEAQAETVARLTRRRG